MSDEITLTIPRQRPFHRIAHLVLGGLAARLNVTLENLEDLQLALDSLLEHEEGDGEVTVDLCVADGKVEVEIGPFRSGRLQGELDRDPQDGSVGLSRVLATVVDDVELTERDGLPWIRLVKDVHEPAEASRG